MYCNVCNRSNCHEHVETSRRVSNATTGVMDYKTFTVYTRCTNCGEITNYSTTGPLTTMGVPHREQK